MSTPTTYTFTDSEFGSFVLATAERIHDSLEEQGEAFHMTSGARLYGGNKTGRNITFIASNPDVYDLLQIPPANLVKMFDSAFIVTTGWASPLGANGQIEGRPSEHPQRRRVRVIIAVSDDVEGNPYAQASVLTFEDDPTNPILDLGYTNGMLADAVHDFYFKKDAQ